MSTGHDTYPDPSTPFDIQGFFGEGAEVNYCGNAACIVPVHGSNGEVVGLARTEGDQVVAGFRVTPRELFDFTQRALNGGFNGYFDQVDPTSA